MRIYYFLILIFSLTLTFLSCKIFDDIIKKPVITFDNFSTTRTTLFDGDFLFKFNIKNPNLIAIKLDNFSYKIDIENKNLLKGTQNKNINISSNGTSSLEIPVTINYLDFLTNISEFITKNEISYNISGNVGILGFNIPYTHTGKINIPKLPKVSLKNIKIDKLSLASANINIALEINNQNPFAVNIDNLIYNIKLNNNDILKSQKTVVSDVSSNIKQLNINTELNFIKLGESIYKIFKQASSNYEINGNMMFNVPKYGIKDFPFKENGQVSLKN